MITIRKAELSDPQQAQAVVDLLNRYALHPMGGGEALPEFTRRHLIDELKKHDEFSALLAYDGAKPVGLCNCFKGFSTFACKPLLNIHDLYVGDGYRNRGIARQLLASAEALAHETGCNKLTLEVLSGNAPAKKSYRDAGFKPYRLNDEFGQAEFWQKYL